MHDRFTSIELGKFFFQPRLLHLQPADLLEQVGDQRLLVFRLAAPVVGKQFHRPVHQSPLPVSDLRRMHAELRSQLARRAVLPHRRQGRLRLQPRLDPLPLRSHVYLRKTGPILPGIRLNVVVQFLGSTIPLSPEIHIFSGLKRDLIAEESCHVCVGYPQTQQIPLRVAPVLEPLFYPHLFCFAMR